MKGLRVTAVTKRYGARAVLEAVSLEVAPGEFHGLLGPSGAGKTTLLRVIAGLERPDGGTVLVDGSPVTAPGPRVGMVFQDLGLWPHMPVLEHVRFALGRKGTSKDAMEWLELVKLAARADALPGELSGGERQRLAIARALAPRPGVLLLDEPFKSLDEPAAALLAREVKEVTAKTGTTTLLVSHARAEALALCGRIGYMEAGRLIHDGPPGTYFSEAAPAAAREFFRDLQEPTP